MKDCPPTSPGSSVSSATGLEHVFYVQGSEGPVAQVIQAEGSSKHVMTYVHTDLLGSVGALTDADGALLGEARYYEPFGARRDKDGGSASGVAPAEAALGFTGHRHDDELGLIPGMPGGFDRALARAGAGAWVARSCLRLPRPRSLLSGRSLRLPRPRSLLSGQSLRLPRPRSLLSGRSLRLPRPRSLLSGRSLRLPRPRSLLSGRSLRLPRLRRQPRPASSTLEAYGRP
jgi:hypothetical protein